MRVTCRGLLRTRKRFCWTFPSALSVGVGVGGTYKSKKVARGLWDVAGLADLWIEICIAFAFPIENLFCADDLQISLQKQYIAIQPLRWWEQSNNNEPSTQTSGGQQCAGKLRSPLEGEKLKHAMWVAVRTASLAWFIRNGTCCSNCGSARRETYGLSYRNVSRWRLKNTAQPSRSSIEKSTAHCGSAYFFIFNSQKNTMGRQLKIYSTKLNCV